MWDVQKAKWLRTSSAICVETVADFISTFSLPAINLESLQRGADIMNYRAPNFQFVVSLTIAFICSSTIDRLIKVY
jgi:hypothetical protein